MFISAFAATPSVYAKSFTTATQACVVPSRNHYSPVQTKSYAKLRSTTLIPSIKAGSCTCSICAPIAHQNDSSTKSETKMVVSVSAGEQAIADLMRENEAFARGEAKLYPGVPAEVTRLAVEGQTPSVAVIGCSDSRTAPEIMFRSNVGQIFVIRTAGNTAWGPEALGSLEFAINVLKVKAVLVLGHTKCGAVNAAVGGGQLPGALGEHVQNIQKALLDQGGIQKDVDLMCQVNVKAQIDFLRKDPNGAVAQGEKNGLAVRGAVYDITTGQVRLVA